MPKKAMIAMSGGVDSSVAAYLIKKAGYETVGITLKLFDNEDVGICRDKTCCSLDDIEDARSVAYKLSIPYHVFNFRDDFKAQVIDRFVDAYINGRTPNPCIDCNKYIKFKKLLNRAYELDFDYVVTGHYAICEYSEKYGRYILRKAVDETKDQSYVLYSLTQEQLSKTLFPLGTLRKSEVRKIAEDNGFVNAKKHDSQDICFVKDGDYAAFIENYTKKSFPSGDFIDTEGNILGKHKGIIRYTIGQRKGLGLSLKSPLYVCEKNTENNTVTLCDEKELYQKELFAQDINLIAYERLPKDLRVKAKTRYKQKEVTATANMDGDNRIHVVFDESQRAFTKGQAVVLYEDDVVVGGGTII